jgi:hypothetical protein
MTRGSPTETCGDHGGRRQDGAPCGHAAGWGTDFDTGKCRICRGTKPDGTVPDDHGAPTGNTNAVTHGAYADANSYYQDVLDEDLREFVDDVFADYFEKYRELHGDPPLGIEAELFRVAVTHAKDIGLDRWADEKPDGLESGHPLVDEETELVPIGDGMTETQRSYRESVVLRAQKRLSTDRRQWLKDLGLLEDPESQKADALGDLKDAWKTSAQDGT